MVGVVMMVVTGPHDRAQDQPVQNGKLVLAPHTLPSSSAVEAGARGKVGEGNFAG